MDDVSMLNRWRLVLGRDSAKQIPGEGMPVSFMEMEDLLEFLYSREKNDGDGSSMLQAGSGGSNLTVASWITKIRQLFPKQTVEVLERHALERYEMIELLNDKEVLERLEPNMDLLKTIMQLSHMMHGDVLETARRIVRKVADDLTRKLETQVRAAISGAKSRSNSNPVRTIRNLDFRQTIRRNLKNYDPESKRLVLDKVYFHGRVRRFNSWRVIICVDESGSMLSSVIHSAIMAGIFARMPMLDTRLVIFDTQVVDLSGYSDDPVETLMSVQLGGGTDIAGALGYCRTLVEMPYRTMLVLVSDLCEGGSRQKLFSHSTALIESGVKFIALTALDTDANSCYDRSVAQRLANMGAHVGAMTPEHLAEWVGRIIS